MSEKEKRERRLDILLMDFSMKLSKIFFFYLLYKIDFINMHSGKIIHNVNEVSDCRQLNPIWRSMFLNYLVDQLTFHSATFHRCLPTR